MKDAIKRWQVYNGHPLTGNPHNQDFYLISCHADRLLHPIGWNRIFLAAGAFVDVPHLDYQAYIALNDGTLGRMLSKDEVPFHINSGRCRGARSMRESARANREAVREAERCQAKKGLS